MQTGLLWQLCAKSISYQPPPTDWRGIPPGGWHEKRLAVFSPQAEAFRRSTQALNATRWAAMKSRVGASVRAPVASNLC
jgi:hypothetical protein